ncbi:ABC transporter ATPase [Capnocytophaga sp.]|uniref:ABC transporter ATPase n=1 Tax=Capnocytophaga sp. TaxID=44737 RepID=UPI0026DC3763|nr:ABC transporter ATPase [Capnocytophaga sp.]MDO5106399.1 ABC transporter ATPase [Capnocytophaga sp.]
MYINFTELPDSARIWIYQSNRSFSASELPELELKIKQYLEGWTAHGLGLQAAFELRYNRFIVIGVNQEVHSVSGCSLDDLARFIQQLEKDYQVDLLDRMNVSYRQGEFIAYKNLADFKKMVKNKSVSGKTIVFNNLVNTKLEYEAHWEIPLEESWHSRFL